MIVTRERLINCGFSETEPEAFRKCMKAWDMPYVRQHMIDDETIFEDSVVEVTVLDGKVCLEIPSADYREDWLEVESPEGLGVLMDAGFSGVTTS